MAGRNKSRRERSPSLIFAFLKPFWGRRKKLKKGKIEGRGVAGIGGL